MKPNMLFEKLISNTNIYIIIIAALLVLIVYLNTNLLLVCVGVFVCVILYSFFGKIIKKSEIKKYIDELNFNIDAVTKDTLLNFQMPLLILKSDGNILWNNANFGQLLENEDIDEKVAKMLSLLKDEQKKTKSNSLHSQIVIDNRTYDIYANIVKMEEKSKKSQEFVILMYLLDKTDFLSLQNVYNNSRLCVGLIGIDNYEELVQTLDQDKKIQVSAIIGKILRNWLTPANGIVIEKEKDKFIVMFEKGYLNGFIEQKFKILQEVKDVDFGTKTPVTISGGLVIDDNALPTKYADAFSTLDVALGRGGDQIVLSENGKYNFFGGQSVEVEKRTKVKSRVVAQALKELMQNSKNIVIMGHQQPDVDCIGAGLGLYRMAETLGKEAYIIMENEGQSLKNLFHKLEENGKYDTVFINKSEALAKTTPETLLIVVDTHRKDYVEYPELLEETDNIVVIDHHRRVVEAIQNMVLTFHEVYASSTCELVSEILQYVDVKIDLEPLEAQAMYSGIMVDTKNFTLKSGVRTFEAAAYLRKMGADITVANQMFKTDWKTYVAISDIVKDMEVIKDNIGISICPNMGKDTMIITAQAADEMLNIDNIYASFVLCMDEQNRVCISGRSLGNINVQVILEQLGGGGHISMAGAQLTDVTIEEGKQKLIDIINNTEIKII